MHPLLRLYEARDAAAAPALAGKVECQEKCNACCTSGVPISMAEARLILDHGPRLDVQRARDTLLRHDMKTGRGAPCMFLGESSGLCTIYDIRPLVCRLHNSVSRATCETKHRSDVVVLHLDKLFVRIAQALWAGVHDRKQVDIVEDTRVYAMPAALLAAHAGNAQPESHWEVKRRAETKPQEGPRKIRPGPKKTRAQADRHRP